MAKSLKLLAGLLRNSTPLNREEFRTPPVKGLGRIRVGQVIENGGQKYACIGLEPYTRQDGAGTELAVLETHCRTCGGSFAVRVPAENARPELNRRCQRHKRPGSKPRRTPHAVSR